MERIRKILVNTAWEVKLLHNSFDVSMIDDDKALHAAIEKEFDAAVAALATLIKIERLEARIQEIEHWMRMVVWPNNYTAMRKDMQDEIAELTAALKAANKE